MAETTTETTKPKKGNNAWGSITAMIIGIVMIMAGTFSWFGEEEDVNNMLIQAGTSQTCAAVLAEYPEAKPYMVKVADVLTAAIEARQAKPEQLEALISTALSDLTGQGINVDVFVRSIVARINKAYETSPTEEQYVGKLKLIIDGIKDSVN